MKLLVCGGAGFIGSTFVRQRLREHGDEVTVLDKLTYAGREENFHDIASEPGFRFVHGAIEDEEAVATAIEAGVPAAIVNFAAETHVDRSIAEPDAFVRTHALGTYVLLEAARELELRYVQVSTDEVYGSIEVGTFTEDSPLRPSSPYSATKTGADLLVQSYFHTYGLPATIVRGSNNYGPYQYPEKLIPLMILNALHSRERLRARDRARARARRAGRGLQRGRARRAGEHRGRQANHRAHGRVGVTDRARQRSPRPRPSLLALLGEGARTGLGAAGGLRGRPVGDGRVVSRERLVVGADPLR
jgi:nucleoside-diphosphate-sugar epimerase